MSALKSMKKGPAKHLCEREIREIMNDLEERIHALKDTIGESYERNWPEIHDETILTFIHELMDERGISPRK